ncbi:hypothetical protein C1752_02815 [Acaryochloris thomasi RCC1774]|uniref:Uncharacterized protein n=1 Tax=Acaryochloris thomasi RCC1774 TaxID=1764569 RepID=A0A2W1JIL8_9CYAN|nr:hypothetical protein C1752_02815 [Acaryochloris thomasi RCC1774]
MTQLLSARAIGLEYLKIVRQFWLHYSPYNFVTVHPDHFYGPFIC